ncbi:MAG: DSD1 family PLP-dependent enzyme [Alphaproteobacteria bacterium]|nr:DSD1 family PLP-dependent enzyme [Alphaproteobacteria bacterium]
MTLGHDLGPNAPLIGKPGSRGKLITPALVLDLDALEHNIAAMQAFARSKNVTLRPHVKTHKSVEVARRQLAAGAIGFSAATLGEARALVAAGLPGVLITSPIVPTAKIEALIALNRKATDLMVVADHPSNLAALEAAASSAGTPLGVVIDLDVGLQRTGADSVQSALALARQIISSRHLRLRGIQGYAGHLQHVISAAERRQASNEALASLGVLHDQIRALGSDATIVSGGGTGTYDIDSDGGVLTELQVGSYVFMDVQYVQVEPTTPAGWRFKPALFVQASVISASHPGHVTIDAGLKCFATDGPVPDVCRGAPPNTTYKFMGDEHGRLVFARPEDRLPLGAVVECFVPHCDPTVNLHDLYHVVRGEVLVDIWPVDARGDH